MISSSTPNLPVSTAFEYRNYMVNFEKKHSLIGMRIENVLHFCLHWNPNSHPNKFINRNLHSTDVDYYELRHICRS